MPRNRRSRSNKLPPRPAQPTLKGGGDYTVEDRNDLKRIAASVKDLQSRIPKVSGGAVGRGIGSLLGMGDLGERLGKSAATLLGMGDYTIKGNTLMQSMQNPNAAVVPVFDKNGRRGVRVTEREYIGDVRGSVAFANTSYAINPSNSSAFPWLSTIARQFEQWEPHGIVFQYVSTSSDFNGVGQALGTVIMATDYDVYDPVATSKVQLENMDYAQSTKPSNSAMHGIECDPNERPTEVFYVGDAGPDRRFNTLGNFQLATQGMTGVSTLGELWVTYDITFYKKQLNNVPDLLFQCESATVTTGVTSLLGTATITAGSSPEFRVEQVIGTGTRIIFPDYIRSPTLFRVLWSCNSSSGIANFPLIASTNTSITQDTLAFESASTYTSLYSATVQVTGPDAALIAPISTVDATAVTFEIHSIPSTF